MDGGAERRAGDPRPRCGGGRGLGGQRREGGKGPETDEERNDRDRRRLEPGVVRPGRREEESVGGEHPEPDREGQSDGEGEACVGGRPGLGGRRVAARERLVGAPDDAVAGKVDDVVGDADGELPEEHRRRQQGQVRRRHARRGTEGERQGGDDERRAGVGGAPQRADDSRHAPSMPLPHACTLPARHRPSAARPLPRGVDNTGDPRRMTDQRGLRRGFRRNHLRCSPRHSPTTRPGRAGTGVSRRGARPRSPRPRRARRRPGPSRGRRW